VKLERQEIASFRYPPGELRIDQMKTRACGEVDGPLVKEEIGSAVSVIVYIVRYPLCGLVVRVLGHRSGGPG
jgi:hypothetical protein